MDNQYDRTGAESIPFVEFNAVREMLRPYRTPGSIMVLTVLNREEVNTCARENGHAPHWDGDGKRAACTHASCIGRLWLEHTSPCFLAYSGSMLLKPCPVLLPDGSVAADAPR